MRLNSVSETKMSGRKLINNVHPFLEMKKAVLFDSPVVDCTVTNDLIIASAYCENINKILYNILFQYEYCTKTDEGKQKFQIKVNFFEQRENILNRMGIRIIKKAPTQDRLITEIKKAIDNNSIVVMHIDLFYQKGRTYYYNEKHGYHAMLIYGYDDEKNLFYTIDNIHGYDVYEVNYDILLEYYIGLHNFLGYKQDDIYVNEYVYSNNDMEKRLKNKDVLLLFCENMSSSHKSLKNSIESIKILKENLDFFWNYENFEEDLATIKYRKGSECYRLLKLKKEDSFDNIRLKNMEENLNVILENWKRIHGLRMYNRIRNNTQIPVVVNEILDDIYNREALFNEDLFNEIDRILQENKKSSMFQ